LIVALQVVFEGVIYQKLGDYRDKVLPRYIYPSNLINQKVENFLNILQSNNNLINSDQLIIHHNLVRGPRKNRYAFDSDIPKEKISDFLSSTPTFFEYYDELEFTKNRKKYPQWDEFSIQNTN